MMFQRLYHQDASAQGLPTDAIIWLLQSQCGSLFAQNAYAHAAYVEQGHLLCSSLQPPCNGCAFSRCSHWNSSHHSGVGFVLCTEDELRTALRAARAQAAAEANRADMADKHLQIERAQRALAEERAAEYKAEVQSCQADARQAHSQAVECNRRIEELECEMTVLR